MTLPAAIAVLNQRRHNDREDWIIYKATIPPGHVVTNRDKPEYWLTPWEAIACAERYLRETAAAAETSDGPAEQEAGA